MNRPTPFDLVFGTLAAERFPALTASLGARGTDPFDRDAFILDQAVTEFLRDLVPEDAPAEALHEFIAVLQHGYLFWDAGAKLAAVTATTLPTGVALAPPAPVAPLYLQLPSHLYWGQLEPDAPHEPLDGCFVHPWRDGIRALAVFGLHPERPGFSVSEAIGTAPSKLGLRADGSLPFAPQMEGGQGAGLRSVSGPDELLALTFHALSSRSPTPEA